MRCQKHDERSYGRMLIATAQPPFDLAEHAVGGHHDVVEEHLGELGAPLIISIGATVIPGVSMSTKNAVMPRWRDSGGPVRVEEDAAVGVLRQAGPHLLAVDRPSSTVGLGVAVRRHGAAARATRGRCRFPVRRSPGTRSLLPRAVAGRTRRRAPAARSRSGWARAPRRASRGPGRRGRAPPARRRARCAASASRRGRRPARASPSASSPASNRMRLHPLHLRDVLVERPGGVEAWARARRGVHRATP